MPHKDRKNIILSNQYSIFFILFFSMDLSNDIKYCHTFICSCSIVRKFKGLRPFFENFVFIFLFILFGQLKKTSIALIKYKNDVDESVTKKIESVVHNCRITLYAVCLFVHGVLSLFIHSKLRGTIKTSSRQTNFAN